MLKYIRHILFDAITHFNQKRTPDEVWTAFKGNADTFKIYDILPLENLVCFEVIVDKVKLIRD